MKKLFKTAVILIAMIILSTPAWGWDRDKEIRDASESLDWYKYRYITSTATPWGYNIGHVTKSFAYKSDGTGIVGISLTSEPIDCQKLTGYWGLQLNVTGTGTASIGYMVSNDGLIYREPEGVTYFATGLNWVSGDEDDGQVYLQFEPILARSLILYITETGFTGSITVTHAKLARQ